MVLVFAFVIGVVLCGVIGNVAARRFHRSAVGWFFVSAFFTPLMAILLLLLVGEKPLQLTRAVSASPQRIEPTF